MPVQPLTAEHAEKEAKGKEKQSPSDIIILAMKDLYIKKKSILTRGSHIIIDQPRTLYEEILIVPGGVAKASKPFSASRLPGA